MANFLSTFTAAGLSTLVEKVLAFTAGIALLFGGQPLAYDAQGQTANAASAIAQGASLPTTIASGDHAATTTIINHYITQPVIERSEQVFVSGSVDPSIAGRLQALEDVFASRPAASIPSISLPAFAQSQRLDQLSGTAISNPTITGGSITGASIAGTLTNAINSAIATIADLTSTELVATNATTTNATTTNLYVAGTVNFAAPLSIASGGIGTSTTPSYGQLLLGNSSGGYDLVATSSLGIASNSTWGSITGTLANQTDLHDALSARLSLSSWYATTTDGLQEGAGNLYFTNSRADQRFATNLAATTTTALTEGSNLYFTADRVAAVFAATTTTAIAEGANLYYTDIRVGSYISGSSTVLHVGGSAYGDIPAWTGSTWNARATSTLGLPTFTDLTSYTPASRSLGTLYPLLGGGDLSGDRTLSLAFGTTTSNTWSGTQTFTNLPSLPLTNGYVLRGSGSNVAEATSTLFIANSGNVGIGTTTPQGKIDVWTTSADTGTVMANLMQPNMPTGNQNYIKLGQSWSYRNQADIAFYYAGIGSSSNALNFGFYGAPTMMSILANGNVGIGTTNPTQAVLVVNGGIAGNYSYGYLASNGGVGYASCSGCYYSIYAGNRIAAPEFNAVSDRRLKTDIAAITSQLADAFIASSTPVSYTWASSTDEGLKFGFIAQDVSRIGFANMVGVVPNPALATTTDPDNFTSPGGAQLVLSYEQIIPLVTKAVQNIVTISGTFQHNLVAFFTTWLGSASNGLATILADRLQAGRELCVGSTCVTETQLQAMLANANTIEAASGGNAQRHDFPGSVVDAEPPVIAVNGNNPAYITAGETYADPGAIITDNIDLNLSIHVFIDGMPENQAVIDTSEPATHLIDYMAIDAAGNRATSTRIVIVERPSPANNMPQ